MSILLYHLLNCNIINDTFFINNLSSQIVMIEIIYWDCNTIRSEVALIAIYTFHLNKARNRKFSCDLLISHNPNILLDALKGKFLKENPGQGKLQILHYKSSFPDISISLSPSPSLTYPL